MFPKKFCIFPAHEFPSLLSKSSEDSNKSSKMVAESEDLRLSLSLCSFSPSSSSQNCFPLKLTLYPTPASPPSSKEAEEDAGAWSAVSTLSSLSGKRSERDDIEGEEDGQNSPKKLRLSKDQIAVLEESFNENNTLNPEEVVPKSGQREPEAPEGGWGAESTEISLM